MFLSPRDPQRLTTCLPDGPSQPFLPHPGHLHPIIQEPQFTARSCLPVKLRPYLEYREILAEKAGPFLLHNPSLKSPYWPQDSHREQSLHKSASLRELHGGQTPPAWSVPPRSKKHLLP